MFSHQNETVPNIDNIPEVTTTEKIASLNNLAELIIANAAATPIVDNVLPPTTVRIAPNITFQVTNDFKENFSGEYTYNRAGFFESYRAIKPISSSSFLKYGHIHLREVYNNADVVIKEYDSDNELIMTKTENLLNPGDSFSHSPDLTNFRVHRSPEPYLRSDPYSPSRMIEVQNGSQITAEAFKACRRG